MDYNARRLSPGYFFAFDCMGAYSAMHDRVPFCAFSIPPFRGQDYGIIKFQGAANTAIETMVDVLLLAPSMKHA